MILVLSCFSGSSYATEETDLETAESQASFGYGYGTKVSSNSCLAIFLIFYKSFAQKFCKMKFDDILTFDSNVEIDYILLDPIYHVSVDLQ